MLRTMISKVTAGAVVGLAVLAWTGQAEAGWRWHGSSGGSSGSWGGSSGGSSGSWGSYGGSSGGWGGYGGGYGHHGHWGHHGWGGSSGGYWGSSGGSSGSWGSSGGSSGGSYYYMPMEVKPGEPPTTAPPAAPAPGTSTSLQRPDGLLTVSVTEDAKIYVNGQPTTSTGSTRQYVSRDLQAGYNYTYEVRAEVVREGRTVDQVKKIDLRAGETANLTFDFPAAESTETSLTVYVPADAKVYLAGNATKAGGETRIFRTTGLASGKSWEGYTVRVELDRGGRTLNKEETITLKAGQSQELRFDFEGDKVASAK